MDNKVIAIAVIAVVAVAGIGVGVWALTRDSGNDGNYTIDGNGGTTRDGDRTLKVASSEKLTEKLLLTFDSSDTKGVIYCTENKDGSGKKYLPGDKVDAGTTIYCKWNPKLTSIGGSDTYLKYFILANADSTTESKTMTSGVVTYDFTSIVGIMDTTKVTWVDVDKVNDTTMSVKATVGEEPVTLTITITNATFGTPIKHEQDKTVKMPLATISEGFTISVNIDA